nr:hypothetical protein ANI_1_264044 [Aspergillus niger CBS 513.88]XP_001395751.2 hypothetical protein ANI_1_824104 [Aspergillus niger CBS 513.88]|eukprot:XP_001390780.2 hypothetical protein ANI_1_264044 [Aspergillus niger CBS 513.88]
MPSHPLHRHQSSLEKVLNFSKPFSLPPHQSQSAANLLQVLIQCYGPERSARKGYKPAALIKATYEHVVAKDTFLTFFFSSIYENLCSQPADLIDSDITIVLTFFDNFTSWSPDEKNKAKSAIEEFADYIIENFLLPLRASSVKTPQPTPASLSAIQTSTPSGTPYRVSILRKSCLVRDRYRCVISRKFDKSEARKRFEQYGEDCKDDEGIELKNESSDRFQFLEVAHILPHCLTTVSSGDADLSDSKKNVLRILDMFDPGVIHLIDGPKIDSPINALTLTLDYHRMFGEFQIYFEPTGVPYHHADFNP